MSNRCAARVYGLFVLVAVGALVASPAQAQYKPRSVGGDPATGETYHIEVAAGLWSPSADISIASESLGIVGTNIDFKQDLGMTDSRFPALKIVLAPTKRFKLRAEYIPISYDATDTKLQRDIVFNGIRYRLGLPVNSNLDWKALGLGLEFDVVSQDRWFAGLVLDLKYTDVAASLESPVDSEFATVKAPIPAIGGIGRVYVTPNISITGEVTGITIPESASKSYNGHYFDVDLYGTLNFTNNIGVQAGYRSIDVGYLVKTDSGNLKLGGLYFGVVARY